MLQDVVMETARLRIRRFDENDADALLRVFGDAEVMRFSDGVQTSEWVRQWIRTCIVSYDLRGYGPWAVVRKSDDACLGYCGLFYFDNVNGKSEIEIGYRLARHAWGKGYATEAVCAVSDYAFDMLGLTRLIALIDPHNSASIRVAEKIGMHHEADVMFAGYDHPDRVYAIEA
jgi:RimJ/RimL family protein N-acetyltransferase